MPEAPVTVRCEGGVAVLSLNRPDRHNAINDEMHDAMDEAFASLRNDSGVRVVLLRGEGRSFCSGRDTAELGRRVGGESDVAFLRRHQASRQAQLSFPKPIVAALKGAVLGGGLEIALACDMRIAAADAQLAFPEVGYGLVTDTGGIPLTTLLAGPSRAKRMVMTGLPVGAQQALAWGLVDEVVAPDALDDAALELCAKLAEAPEQLLGMVKELVDGVGSATVTSGMTGELYAQLALFSQRRSKEA